MNKWRVLIHIILQSLSFPVAFSDNVDAIYHHFELDGVIYAYSVPGTMLNGEIHPNPLLGDKRFPLDDEIQFIRLKDGKPI